MASKSHHVTGSKAFCQTEVLLAHSAFTWVIKNFSFCCPKGESETIDSEKFYSGPYRNYVWRLKLRSEERNSRQGMVFLILPPQNIKYAIVKCALLDSNGKNLHSVTKDIRQSHLDESKKSEVFGFSFTKPLSLPNDVLTIQFETTVSHNQVSTFIQSCEMESMAVSKNFINALSSLCENAKFADFTLTVGGQSFPAHKAILAACSPVFEAMFEHDLKEKKSGIVVISDFEVDTVRSLLRFMYTRQVPNFNSLKHAISIFEIADKYEVNELKEICKKYLILILDANNVVDILCSADRHCDETLRQEALAFIESHPNINVDNSSRWDLVPDILWKVIQPIRNFDYNSVFFDKPKIDKI